MRHPLLSAVIALAVTASLTGCGTPSEAELSLTDTTYGLMEPWCQINLQDGTTRLYPDKCVSVVAPGSVARVARVRGTCLKLGQPRVSYPGFTRTLEYDVILSGVTARMSAFDFAGAQGLNAVVRRKCSPTQPFGR